MKDKLTKLLFNSGLEKEVYEEYKSYIFQSNTKNLSLYLLISGLGFLCLFISSFISSGFAHINALIYFLTTVSFFVILILQKITQKLLGENSGILQIYVFLFMAVLYIESIVLTLNHQNMPAVTYIGVLLVLPLLFAEPPLSMGLVQCLFVAVFCLVIRGRKLPEVVSVDTWNGITFLVVSLVVILIVVPMRTRLMVQHEFIKKLSETDLLTGLRNRNSFELDCKTIQADGDCPGCIYADVNGLHELNNEKGHAAGDEMLKTVALSIKKEFGAPYSYRIGGDEFVAFVYDLDVDSLTTKLSEIKEDLINQGYHVSFGLAKPESEYEELEMVLKRAEQNMYLEKKSYYATHTSMRKPRN